MDWLPLERDGDQWSIGGDVVENGEPVAVLCCTRVEGQAEPRAGVVTGTLVLQPRRRPMLHLELTDPEGQACSQVNVPLAFHGVFVVRLADVPGAPELVEAAG